MTCYHLEAAVRVYDVYDGHRAYQEHDDLAGAAESGQQVRAYDIVCQGRIDFRRKYAQNGPKQAAEDQSYRRFTDIDLVLHGYHKITEHEDHNHCINKTHSVFNIIVLYTNIFVMQDFVPYRQGLRHHIAASAYKDHIIGRCF